MTTNGCKLHDIDHFSPSSLGLAATQLSLWIAQYLFKRRTPMGPPVHRGSAVEDGVAAGLLDPGKRGHECQEIALASYDRLMGKGALGLSSTDPGYQKERDAIPGMVTRALAELQQYGIPKTQGQVSHVFDDIPVPIIGRYDFFFEEHGIIVDLKTQLRLSSSISTAHARQVGLYVHDTNWEGRVCYTTPSKLAVYRVEDPAASVADLCNIARRLNRFLAISADPAELAAMVIPDTSSFYWGTDSAKALCREIYGL